MHRPNALKQRIVDGRKSFGLWANLASPLATEVVAQVGYDFIIIDNEHGPGTYADTLGQLQAIDTTPTSPVVRVPWNDHVYIKRVLDMGAPSLLIPNIQTVEEAKQAIGACRYPPHGFRGSAYSIARGANFGGLGAGYIESARENLLIMLQIETKSAIDQIPEIAKLDGVDLLFIGPNDLSGSIGKLAQFHDPEVKALIARAEDAIVKTGKPMGIVPHGDRDAAKLFRDGYSVVSASADISLLRSGAVAEVDVYRKEFGA